MSQASEDAIRALAIRHRLGRMINPGGIAYTTPEGRRCQISDYEDEDDLVKLEAFLTHTCPVPDGLRTGDIWPCATCGRAWRVGSDNRCS